VLTFINSRLLCWI